jgi:CheY-like chemotaxis protein
VSVPETCQILIVDDVPDNLFLLQSLLEMEGYSVKTADCGTAALEQLQQCEPNLVLLDIMMPDMDGYEVTRLIRQDQRIADLPVILITAYEQADQDAGFAAGANEFVYKPINFDRLLNIIKQYS